MPTSGNTGPNGTLNERGALGSLRRRIKTSMFANMYEIIQNTEPTRIKKLIASEEPSLNAAKQKITTLTKITPTYGTLCLFVFANTRGIIFIFAMP